MKDTGAEYLQFRLMAKPHAAWRARRVVGSVLDGWQLGGMADDVVTCVSELVANVHEHAANSAIAELFLLWVPGAFLSAEVRDQDPRMPRRRPVANLRVPPFGLTETDNDELELMQLAEAGRGLAVVEALCDRLWWRPDSSGGKVVRCHWRLKAATDTARNHPEHKPFAGLTRTTRTHRLGAGSLNGPCRELKPARRFLDATGSYLCRPGPSLLLGHHPPGTFITTHSAIG